ncbi:MAG: DUF5689 domain-containing protein [Dysgonamonadaceae bacterium]|nr:DUF5689 domain-containing protein [Dysgonamonadaceae bacterium]MDD4729837.1 DUF5689 domain-containing protein [Dysgonamonadaceae bacterium]
MIKSKKQFWESIASIIFITTISFFLFTNCMTEIGETIKPLLTFSDDVGIAFDKNAGSMSIEITCNQEWSITKEAGTDWIVVSPTKGKEGITKLTIEVKSNDGETRKGSFTITCSTLQRTITIVQEGQNASIVEPTTIKEIRSMYADMEQAEWVIAEPLKIKGVVISDRVGGNRPSQRDGFIQDKLGDGIAFRVTQSSHSFDMGDELDINLDGAKILNYGGVLMIVFSNKAAKMLAQNVAVAPKVLTIEDILNGWYDGTLVKIKDVQFKTYEELNYYEKGIATNRILEDCNGDNIIVRTTKYATFKDKPLPAGKGNLFGIVSLNNGVWQIAIRNLDDLKEMSNDESTRCKLDVPPVTENFIVADKNDVTFEKEGGEEIIKITANVDWLATTDEFWLKIAPDSGTNDGILTIIASKNEGAERKATITITGGVINKTVLIVQKAAESSSDVATDLFFSEYVEGSSYNKYLEVYNGTGAAVGLSDYRIELYSNGNNEASKTQELTGVLQNGEVIVFKHSKAIIYEDEATVSTVINFNGNDAIALVKISTDTYVDIIGCIGHDPGKAWIDSIDKDLSTLDKTLVRKPSIRCGVTVNPVECFPTLSTEWISYPEDTSDYLGWHTMK